MRSRIPLIVAVSLVAGACLAGESPAPPTTERDKMNYSVGYQIGGDFRKQGVELDSRMLVQGIQDAMGDGAPQVSKSEMQKALAMLKSRITASEQQRKSAQYEADRKEGRAFLAENGKKEGVVSLPGGIQYRVIREGAGDPPALSDNVTVHYTGAFIDGKEFYTTRNAGTPQNIMVGNLIPGMSEVVRLMKPGSRWQAFIPAEKGYAGGNPLYGKTVIFDIELIQVHPKTN